MPTNRPSLTLLRPDDAPPSLEWKVVADRAPHLKFTNPGDSVLGRFLCMLDEEGPYGTSPVAYLTVEGEVRRLYATSDLQPKLADVQTNTLVRIVYLGLEQTKRVERRKLFKVEVACVRAVP